MIGYIHMNKSVHVITTDADRFVSTGLNSWYIYSVWSYVIVLQYNSVTNACSVQDSDVFSDFIYCFTISEGGSRSGGLEWCYLLGVLCIPHLA